ncbi:hypothetical protein F0562_019172 [Nyssa sinensis]|uniref:Uncharacterized protein n=1 Tax=Nyssa sinensis TaxID=561372 RepID=A0A5J4ZB38_9ASTE|nr:hypothetical protein F0562_019172 [Nyssa sinensis]
MIPQNKAKRMQKKKPEVLCRYGNWHARDIVPWVCERPSFQAFGKARRCSLWAGPIIEAFSSIQTVMASTSLSSLALPCTDSKSQRSFPMERQPRMLKDFLSSDELNSCSSNGFKSSPRQSTVRNLLEFDLEAKNNVAESKLLRSRSRAASTTISAVHKASEIVINAVKSSSVLPRSISWRLLRREFWNNKCKNDDLGVISATVKVKDILRWRSFRDLIEEKPPPLDFDFSSSSPCRCTTLTGSTSTDSSSNSSSWCESNFIAKYLPWWY